MNRKLEEINRLLPDNHTAEISEKDVRDAFKLTFDGMQEMLNSLTLGGRNLALNSKQERQGTGTNKNTLELLKATAYVFSEPQKIGEDYTVSFLAKATGSQRRFIPYISGTQLIGEFILSDNFQKYTATYRATTTLNHIHLYGFGITDLRVKDFKIEKGKNPTDWTPAPEDVEAKISGLFQNLPDATRDSMYNKILVIKPDGSLGTINRS